MENNTESPSSGYSSLLTSPQSSDEDLLIKSRIIDSNLRSSTELLELKARIPRNLSLEFTETGDNFENRETRSDETENEEEFDFKPVHDPNELDVHREWYDKLLLFRIEFHRGKRGPFPPFPPPPLPSVMIAASRAVSFNSFEAVKRAATSLSFQSTSPSVSSLGKRSHRFSPSDFQPLPPPPVYLNMIKTLAPHQYIDLTYALAGSVLLGMGVKVPDAYPPLPPKIEPFRDFEAEERALMTEMSSQSSSEGEYSDASEHSRFIDRLKRRKNRERRAAREIRINARNLASKDLPRVNDAEEMKKETFSRETVYKEKTLSSFIKRRPLQRPPLPPPFFFPPDFHAPRGPFPPPPPPRFIQPPHPSSMMISVPFPMDLPFDPPVMCVPLYLLSPPETPSSSMSSLHNNSNYQIGDLDKLHEKMSKLKLRKRE